MIPMIKVQLFTWGGTGSGNTMVGDQRRGELGNSMQLGGFHLSLGLRFSHPKFNRETAWRALLLRFYKSVNHFPGCPTDDGIRVPFICAITIVMDDEWLREKRKEGVNFRERVRD